MFIYLVYISLDTGNDPCNVFCAGKVILWSFWSYPWVAGLGIYHCFMPTWEIGLCCLHLYLVASNLTTNEHLGWKKYPHLNLGHGSIKKNADVFHNPFTLGLVGNVTEFFELPFGRPPRNWFETFDPATLRAAPSLLKGSSVV